MLFLFLIAHPLLILYRNPGLDDQAVFWKVIRQNSDPAINPIGMCRDVVTVPLNSNSTDSDQDAPLTTCFLDICMFSSGMISGLYVPEFTYGRSLPSRDHPSFCRPLRQLNTHGICLSPHLVPPLKSVDLRFNTVY